MRTFIIASLPWLDQHAAEFWVCMDWGLGEDHTEPAVLTASKLVPTAQPCADLSKC